MSTEREAFLAHLRAQCADVSQQELARELDITQGHLSRILAGLAPGPKTARKLVQRFPDLRDAVADLFLTPA